MRAKEYLQGVQRLDMMIDQKVKELSDLRQMVSGVGGIDYAKERVQTSPSGDAPFIRQTLRIVELEQEINDAIDVFVNRKHKIIDQIQTLENVNYVDLLYKRYIEYKSLEQIAVEMHFSYNHTRHLHGYALQAFENTGFLQKSAQNSTQKHI